MKQLLQLLANDQSNLSCLAAAAPVSSSANMEGAKQHQQQLLEHQRQQVGHLILSSSLSSAERLYESGQVPQHQQILQCMSKEGVTTQEWQQQQQQQQAMDNYPGQLPSAGSSICSVVTAGGSSCLLMPSTPACIVGGTDALDVQMQACDISCHGADLVIGPHANAHTSSHFLMYQYKVGLPLRSEDETSKANALTQGVVSFLGYPAWLFPVAPAPKSTCANASLIRKPSLTSIHPWVFIGRWQLLGWCKVHFNPCNHLDSCHGCSALLSCSAPLLLCSAAALFCSLLLCSACTQVVLCPKRYGHNWGACPYAHEGEKVRRRDPRNFQYSSCMCPDASKGECRSGLQCPYAHTLFEYWCVP
jgi:hypothetical protein